MTTIDLGEVTDRPIEPAIPIDHRRLIRAALAVCTMAGLFAVAGSAHGAAVGVRPLWITSFGEDDTVALDSDTAYVSRLDNAGQPTVTAYDLDSGAPRWSAPTGDTLAHFAVRPAGDTVLAPADPVTMTYQEADGSRWSYVSARTTIALDAATGYQLWRADGDARPSASTGTALIAEQNDEVHATGLRLVRLRDGAEIWNVAVPPLAGWTPLPDSDHPLAIATATTDGRLSVYGYADGKLRASSRVPWETKTRSATLIPAGRDLAVIRDDPSRDSITTVYSADDLKPLWTSGYVTSCGDLLCSIGRDGVAGRDPATGRAVWTAPRARTMFPVTDDRILLGADLDGTSLQLTDSHTGRPLGGVVTGSQAFTTDPSGDLLFVRPSLEPPGQLVVTRLGLADGAQTSLGLAGPSGERSFCIANPGYLACPRTDGLHVMALG